jgi:hypothetical protein
MKNRGWIAAALGMAALIGCGGRVIVDGLQQGEGAGGQGQGQGQGQGPSFPVLGCSSPPDPATLESCGDLGSTGPGGATICGSTFCDSKGNAFDSTCQGNTCVCAINGVTQCACTLNGPGAFCSGMPTCCPWGE